LKNKFLCLLLIISLAGCNKLSPAGFWNDFDNGHINDKSSDQGPWGGSRIIYWENKGKYKDSDVLKFAADNGWTLIGSENELAGGEDSGWMKYSGKLYTFNSGWAKVEEDEYRNANGYLLISTDHTKMSVYHNWGE
jgi:hypothetical protein